MKLSCILDPTRNLHLHKTKPRDIASRLVFFTCRMYHMARADAMLASVASNDIIIQHSKKNRQVSLLSSPVLKYIHHYAVYRI